MEEEMNNLTYQLLDMSIDEADVIRNYIKI